MSSCSLDAAHEQRSARLCDCSRQMTGCCGRSAARQNEFLQGRQRLIEFIQRVLQPIDMRRRDHPIPRHRQLTAQVEQLMLNRVRSVATCRLRVDLVRPGSCRSALLASSTVPYYASIRAHASSHPRPVAQSGRAVVTGACVRFSRGGGPCQLLVSLDRKANLARIRGIVECFATSLK